MEGNLLTEDEQWAKLRLVAETARRGWGGKILLADGSAAVSVQN